MGPFRVISATNLVVRYQVEIGEVTATSAVFLPGLEIWVERQHPRWKEPYVMVLLERDKNVHASRARLAPIPCRCVGVFPAPMLESYLCEVGPPSGGTVIVLKSYSY